MTVVLFRADAAAAIGAGHVMRCLAVGEAVQAAGGEVVFACAQTLPGPWAHLDDAGFRRHRLLSSPGTPADAEETAALALCHGAKAIVLDGYRFDSDYRARLRAIAKLGFFDDGIEPGPIAADLVINAAPDADRLPYHERAPHARALLGPAYTAIRQEILTAARAQTPPLIDRQAVFVNFGGTDPLGLSLPCAQALVAALPATVSVIVLLGRPPSVETAAGLAALGTQVQTVVESREPGQVMAGTGLAVSAAGGTAAELATLGIPLLLVVVADNQRAGAQALAKRGLATIIDASDSLPKPAIAATTARATARAAARMWAAATHRVAISEALQTLYDGGGALRIADALLSLP